MLNTNLIQKILTFWLIYIIIRYFSPGFPSQFPDDISQQLEKISKNSEEEKDTNFNRILFSGRTELQSSTMSKDR